MKKLLDTIFIILLALGLMGIILGISVGLYRNDMLAKMQAAEELNIGLDDQTIQEQYQGDGLDAGDSNVQKNTLVDLLLWGNLHTAFLAAGTLLTILSVIMFLMNLKRTFPQ